jgi:hypothetical protein
MPARRLRYRVSLVLVITLPPHAFAARYARVEGTAMRAEADLQRTPRAPVTFGVRGWAIGVNAESAK